LEDDRLPFDVADHTFNISTDSKEAKMKICPLFVACSQTTCRYWKPIMTGYRYIFCYNCWEGSWDTHQIYKGGMAVNDDPEVMKHVEAEGNKLNGEFITLVDIDE
jgi:hypothetical protein